MKLLIFGHSSLGTHRVSIGFLTRFHKRDNWFVCTYSAESGKFFCANTSTSDSFVTPGRALPTARRLIASFQQSGLGCSHAPRPGMRRATSTNASVSPEALVDLTKRTSWIRSDVPRHPIHVRTAFLASVASLCAATAFLTNSAVPSCSLSTRAKSGPALNILPRSVTAYLNRCGIRDNVNAPSGQLGSKARVLPFLTNSQRQLIIRDNNPRRARSLINDRDRNHLRRGE